jgi:hypothetical protein
MKRFLIYILPFVFFVFISVNSKAQINFNQKEQFPKVKPNSLYIEQYLKNTSLLKNSKALIIGSNESYNIYQLPLDNMPCAMPNTQITQLTVHCQNPGRTEVIQHLGAIRQRLRVDE